MEVDFSQLEVVGLAILSGDEILADDIMMGRDMHTVRAAELWNIPESSVTEAQRQTAKYLSFQLQYGAGAKSLAEKNGISQTLAQQFIDNYYARYRRVKEWQESIRAQVEASRKPTGRHTAGGKPQGCGEYVSPTGRVYRFFEYDNSWRRDTSFSPTEMKNYPVQGFATADIMAVYRGKVYRRLLSEPFRNEALLINTVHDSVMLDVANMEVVECVYRALLEEAAALNEHLKTLWGIETHLPLKVGAKIGHKWSELKKFEL